MRRRLVSHPVHGPNSLRHWPRIIPPWRVVRNFLLIELQRFLPSLEWKARVLRLTGMKVGRNVSVGFKAGFDIMWPELITLQDDCIIGFNSIILAHEFLRVEWRTGPVVIGEGAVIGANCTILAGVTVGDGAVVSAASLVNRDVPAGCFAGGVPVRVLTGRRTIRETIARDSTRS